MKITFDFSQALNQPCDLCSWLDDTGCVELEDNTGSRKLFCHQCCLDLVKACLPSPDGMAPAKTTQSSPLRHLPTRSRFGKAGRRRPPAVSQVLASGQHSFESKAAQVSDSLSA